MVENLFLEVIRAFYSYCHDVLGSDLKLSYTQSGNPLGRYELSFRILSHPPLPSRGPSSLLFSVSHAVLRRWAGHGSEHPRQLLPSNREESLAWPLGYNRECHPPKPLDLLYTRGEAREKGNWKMGERELRNEGEETKVRH